MTTATGSMHLSAGQATSEPWLRNARWDLTFVILSIVVAGIPYAAYLLFGGATLDAAGAEGSAAYNARLIVNTLVTLLIGGPHMYATFTRTVFDPVYLRRRKWFLLSTLAVPVAVIFMAVYSYQSYLWLLSIFFAMASLHALYQVIWLTDAYSLKAKRALSWPRRLIDYGVVLSSLYPIATYKMVRGDFRIGSLALKYNEIVAGWWWLAALAAAGFAVLLVAWLVKTFVEWHEGTLNVPKTLLIAVTVALMFWTPAFPNMDTAFQGVNTWHSFQYLVIVWYANRLHEEKLGRPVGFMHWGERPVPPLAKPIGEGGILAALRRIDRGSGWTYFYLVCIAMMPISGALMVGSRLIWPHLHAGLPGADEAYNYIGVLSILLVHYVQDGLLFTDAKSLVPST